MDIGVALGERLRAVLLIVPLTGVLMVLSLFVTGPIRFFLLIAALVIIYPLIIIVRRFNRKKWGNMIGVFGNCSLYDNGIYIDVARGLDLFVEWNDIIRWEETSTGSLIVTLDGTEIETPLPLSELEKLKNKNNKQ
ncbi:MAG: hypothetical protein RXO22_02725 [Thermocladium sp.]|jgi:hypothetical protein|nr:MAG: hypothetical protein AT710_06985 [Thermocladium sp. ECH_B]